MGDTNIDVKDTSLSGTQYLSDQTNSFHLTIITKGKACIIWGHNSSLNIILKAISTQGHLNWDCI